MASNLERARAMLSSKAPLPLYPTAVSVFQPLESETVKHAKNRGVSAFHGVAGETDLIAGKAAYVSPETSSETISETLKQAPQVSLPDPEREAIMLASGGLPSTWAKVFSALDPDRAPIGLTRPYWLARLDAILIFGDKYGHHLNGLGWNAELLFCLGEHWQRLNERGIGWFVAEALADGGKVTDMTWRWVRYETKRGAGRTIWNAAWA